MLVRDIAIKLFFVAGSILGHVAVKNLRQRFYASQRLAINHLSSFNSSPSENPQQTVENTMYDMYVYSYPIAKGLKLLSGKWNVADTSLENNTASKQRYMPEIKAKLDMPRLIRTTLFELVWYHTY